MNECPECGSEKIVKDAALKEMGDYAAENTLRVAVDRNPDAWVFKERVRNEVRAEVCGACGFVQTYATDPDLLWRAYQSSLSDVE